MTMPPNPQGLHLIADLSANTGMDDPVFVETVLREAASAAQVTLIDVRLHHFGLQSGVTGVALLAESHISIHTWPELGLMAIDIFTCGPTARPDAALEEIKRRFNAQVICEKRIVRLSTVPCLR